MTQMAKLHEFAHFHIGHGSVLAPVSRNKPMNADFHTAHGTLYHEPAPSMGPTDFVIICDGVDG